MASTELSRNFGLWQDRAAAQPVFVTHHGRARTVLLSLQDYTRLGEGPRPAAEEPASAAARFDALLGQMEESFIAIDPRFRITAANAAAALHLNRARQALTGRGLAELLPEAGQPLLGRHIRRALNGGQGGRAEIRSLHYPALVQRFHIFPLRGGAGLLFRSVEEERQAALLAARLGSLSTALSTHDAIGLGRIGLRGAFEQVETGLARLAGFDAARLVGVRLSDILALSSRVAANDAVEAVLNGGGPRRFASQLLVNGGETIDVMISLAEIRESVAIDGAALVIMASG